MVWKLDQVSLPPDTVWANEIEENRVLQEVGYSIDGSILVEETLKTSGRLIKLDLGGISRSTLLDLRALALDAATPHTLEIHTGSQWEVVFQRPTPIEATPYVDFATSDLDGSELYTTVIYLIRTDGWE